MSPEQIKRIEEITGEWFRMYHYPALRGHARTIEQIEEITGRRFRAYHLPAIREVLAADRSCVEDAAPGISDTPAPTTPGDPLVEALRRVGECLDRAEGAAGRLHGEDGRSVREALDDASEIVARALKAVRHA